jgi:hypothetical protein
VRLGDYEHIVTRHEYTFITWVAVLGGLFSAFGNYISKITHAISKKVFMNSVLGDLFFQKKRHQFQEGFDHKLVRKSSNVNGD